VGVDAPARLRAGLELGVDREDDALGAEAVGGLQDEPGSFDRRRVEGDLVRAGSQHRLDVARERRPPPTVSGMKQRSAVAATTSCMILRPSLDAVMSRKTSSSAPWAS
jgi:hypothetical protein